MNEETMEKIFVKYSSDGLFSKTYKELLKFTGEKTKPD